MGDDTLSVLTRVLFNVALYVLLAIVTDAEARDVFSAKLWMGGNPVSVYFSGHRTDYLPAVGYLPPRSDPTWHPND